MAPFLAANDLAIIMQQWCHQLLLQNPVVISCVVFKGFVVKDKDKDL